MNILLTGSGGFIGRNILEGLGDRYDFIAPRSAMLDLADADAVSRFFKENDIGLIFHCAAAGVRITPGATCDQVARPNIAMFDNLARFASASRPMITLGSGAEYDKSRPLHKMREEDFGPEPADPYGYSKYMISRRIEGLDGITNLRLFGVYGRYEDPSRLQTDVITMNLARGPMILRRNAVFDFLYIDDFVRIAEFFIRNRTGEKFVNVAPFQSSSMVRTAEIVNEISDFKSEIVVKQQGLGPEYTGDNSLLMRLVPGLEFTPYEEGIKSLYEHIKRRIG